MKLPGSVQAVIDEETAAIPASSLREAAAQLGCAYRMAAQSPLRIDSPAQYLAYAVARMPAIFEVNLAAALELRRLRPALEIRSMLDLGCGPGTATIALRQAFETLAAATCADRDLQWLKLAKRLISAADPRLAAASRFTVFDLHGTARLDQHDLVVMSYVLGELAPAEANLLIDVAWRLTRRAMVIIEPGTPRGFAGVLAARDFLLGCGAGVIAPCTHAGRCPLAAGDWCHFDLRIERSRQHRQVKSGTLAYEIEKFSYLLVERLAATRPNTAARIIRRPLKKSGHVILDLCTAEGTARRVIVARRDRQRYRLARGAKWGDIWDPAATGET